MISVFTPSHDPKHLDDCYRSLVEQTYENWQWLVLLNNGAVWERPKDKRVRIMYNHDSDRGVGWYKWQAALNCHGDIVVELDHDDMLMPEALGEIEYLFDMNPRIGFVYSDTAQIQENGQPDLSEFDPAHGWTYYNEEGFKITSSFPPYPHNLSYIWYAPNHLRAWRKSVYDKIGGYDRTLEVLDDQDLMARFYQNTHFYHIEQCLYLQRIHGKNTQTVRNAEIQTKTVEMYHRDIEANALAWAKREGLFAIDLGAHHNKPEGYLGVDLRPGKGVDIVTNFFDLDFQPNSVGVIRAYDFMEHVGNENRQRFMEKCYELLAHGGMLLSMTPSTDGRGAFQDPTHTAQWNSNSFWYYTQKEYADFVDFKGRFQVSMLRNFLPSHFHVLHDIPYVQANLIAVKEDSRDFGGHLLI